MFDLILKNGTCLTPSGRQRIDIGITQGKISVIDDLADAQAQQSLDLANLHILPGVIDTQVHFREPGNTHKEDLSAGTKAAVLGGVTSIFEMPNTNPPTTSITALEEKLQRAKDRAWCNYAFFVGGTDDPTTDWAILEDQPGCSGIKIFMGSSTGNLLVEQDKAIAHILKQSRRRVAVHCEHEPRLKERLHLAEEAQHPRAHPVWRDVKAAYLATERLIKLAEAAKHPVHILHVTTKEEMALLAKHKDLCTVETTPQHLTLTDAAYEDLGTLAQMNPPIRDAEQQAGLWEAIKNGIVDVIGSDHAPHTLEEKEKIYPHSPSGMPGVQTLVPILLNHVAAGKLSVERFVDLTAHGPARIYQIAGKGRIALGYDADFTIVDLKAKRTITNDIIASKCGWTPFHGMSVTGWPMYTIIRGNVVMKAGEVLDKPVGEKVRFINNYFEN